MILFYDLACVINLFITNSSVMANGFITVASWPGVRVINREVRMAKCMILASFLDKWLDRVIWFWTNGWTELGPGCFLIKTKVLGPD